MLYSTEVLELETLNCLTIKIGIVNMFRKLFVLLILYKIYFLTFLGIKVVNNFEGVEKFQV